MNAEQTKKVLELALDGVQIDGGHHKQWFLSEIIKVIAPKTYDGLEEDEKGTHP